MAYKAKAGGYNWRKTITDARTDLRKERSILTRIVEGDMSQVELYRLISAIALINAAVDDRLADLGDFPDEVSSEMC